ncbi:MAG TPA: hypothetical protein VHD86_23950 [Xanthobacteraceae bacterium]|nr:hypothetical protein [Xanthobacteraceae bacterium]
MSFAKKVPALAASVAAAALLVAVPASAQSNMMTSNQANPNSSKMAKAGPAPDARPSTTAQAPGSDQGSSMMAKVGNQLK